MEIDGFAQAPEIGFLMRGIHAVAQYHRDHRTGNYVVKPFHPDLRHLPKVSDWSLLAAFNWFAHHARSDEIASRMLGLR